MKAVNVVEEVVLVVAATAAAVSTVKQGHTAQGALVLWLCCSSGMLEKLPV